MEIQEVTTEGQAPPLWPGRRPTPEICTKNKVSKRQAWFQLDLWTASPEHHHHCQVARQPSAWRRTRPAHDPLYHHNMLFLHSASILHFPGSVAQRGSTGRRVSKTNLIFNIFSLFNNSHWMFPVEIRETFLRISDLESLNWVHLRR